MTITSTDLSGNPAVFGPCTFTTEPEITVSDPPVITMDTPDVIDIGEHTGTIVATTDKATDFLVEYG